MTDLKSLIDRAADAGASDIHLTYAMPPVLRIDGLLVNMEHPALADTELEEYTRQLTTEEQLEQLKAAGEVDFAVTFAGVTRMRCNIFYQQGHLAVAMRLLPLSVPTVEELFLPDVIVEQASKLRGLVLVTGPTGSGKSTTLAALLGYINHHSRRHIITLENPIEYLYEPDRCVVQQREVGKDTGSFAAGLRAALRQDPDVILVGEMRDLETISTAITAAETGHLVFATLHAKGAVNTVDRIIDAFPSEQQAQIRIQLADVLECTIGQTLLPKVGGGRRAVFEIMTGTSAVRSLIRQSKSFQLTSTIQTSRKQGMVLLDDALVEMVRSGDIERETAIAAANDPANVRMRLPKMP